jgi:hypothetical protein
MPVVPQRLPKCGCEGLCLSLATATVMAVTVTPILLSPPFLNLDRSYSGKVRVKRFKGVPVHGALCPS